MRCRPNRSRRGVLQAAGSAAGGATALADPADCANIHAGSLQGASAKPCRNYHRKLLPLSDRKHFSLLPSLQAAAGPASAEPPSCNQCQSPELCALLVMHSPPAQLLVMAYRTCGRMSTLLRYLQTLTLCLQAWVLLGSAMYAVPLKAERVLYLDTSLPQGGAADALGMGARVSKVKRLTPGGETPPLMYQASLVVRLQQSLL